MKKKLFIPKTLVVWKCLITEKMRKDEKNFLFDEASLGSVYAYGMNKKAEEKLKKLAKKGCDRRKR